MKKIAISENFLKTTIFKCPHSLKVWLWLIFKMEHEDKEVPVKIGRGCTKVKLKKGQLIFKRQTVAAELQMTGSQLYRKLQKLKESGHIYIKTTCQFSIIEVKEPESVVFVDKPKAINVEIGKNGHDVKKMEQIEQQTPNTEPKTQPAKTRRTIPPDFAELSEYCKVRGVDPETFFNFYTSKNWFVGKNKMVDWQAAVRTWMAKNRQTKASEIKQISIYGR